MGVISSRVRFDGEVPELSAIQSAVERRTGLRCKISRDPRHGFIVVKCAAFHTDIDMRISKNIVDLEQPIWMTVYFFDQLRESLIDLGGCRCDHRNVSEPNGTEPTPPVLWRDRKWTERFSDSHPFITSMVWLAIMLPRGLRALLRKKRAESGGR